jgi:hypothetical protein
MASPGGYQVTPGLYRVPDLFTEEQFVAYMWNTYRRKVEFTDTENYVDPTRALGSSDLVPKDKDPVLQRINEMDFSTPVEKKKEAGGEESKADTKTTQTSTTKPTGGTSSSSSSSSKTTSK